MNIKTKEIATVPTARSEEKASSKKAQENEFRTLSYFHRIICAAAIGLIALAFPQTQFFSEKEIETVIETGPALSITMLLEIAFAKMLAISFTLHCGFRVRCLRRALKAQKGGHSAVNVAVTKTPISTSVILSVLCDTSMIPVVAIASFISLFLTSNIHMLKTSAIAHATLWQ